MPEYLISAETIIGQIRNNLNDRYDSGFPILKELLQNADDSGAQKFFLEGLPGWKNANNPLLHGPGLLVVNDGNFEEKDERGILTFGESNKATDNATIGKFGFGQKAVFHLCDAFVVFADRPEKRFARVINPYLKVKITGNTTETWDEITEPDLELLRKAAGKDFHKGCLILWIPLRRDDLIPAPKTSFSTTRPKLAQTIEELIRPDDLQVILSALRSLASIEIRLEGKTQCSLNVQKATGRLLGPHKLKDRSHAFSGEIKSNLPSAVTRFVGSEVSYPSERLNQIKHDRYWPTTLSALSEVAEPEKGEPHAAVTVLRLTNARPAPIKIRWAVFLPTTEITEIALPQESADIGQIHFLLHGYFFLDSGRRLIQGRHEQGSSADPEDAASLRRTWNTELRDTVLLPLIPGVLRETLDAQMMTSAELAYLVTGISQSTWFKDNRSAICRTHSLVRIMDDGKGSKWSVVDSNTKIRPLPKAALENADLLTELFPEIYSWSKERNITLAIDRNAALTASPISWEPEELKVLFETLSARAFQAGALGGFLLEFLKSINIDNDIKKAIGPLLIKALRKALGKQGNLAEKETISAILEYVPSELLIKLPPSVESRHILKIMAELQTYVLPVRSIWLPDMHPSPRISDQDLKVLLDALSHLIDGEHGDQGAIAALAMLMRAQSTISDLAYRTEFSSIKVLRAKNPLTREHLAISLGELISSARKDLLFMAFPDTRGLLHLAAHALPDTKILTIEGKTSEFIREHYGREIPLHKADKENLLPLINRATVFGSPSDRAGLLKALGVDDEDSSTALRKLCAGHESAGAPNVTLWSLENSPEGFEKIVSRVLSTGKQGFLVTSEITNLLIPPVKRHLRIETLEHEALDELFENSIETLAAPPLTEDERVACLLSALSDRTLGFLPIHSRSDGSVGPAAGVFYEADWPIPASLRHFVPILRACNHNAALARQRRIISSWSPEAQIDKAISLPEPHRFYIDVLDALHNRFETNVELDPELKTALLKSTWLVAEGSPIAPGDILCLPPMVDAEARKTLQRNGEILPFFPVGNLAIDIRNHTVFTALATRVLPDQEASFKALAMMIKEAKVVGRLGTSESYPLEDFIAVANDNADLAIPGWPLLSAILRSIPSNQEMLRLIVSSFAEIPPQDPAEAANYLDSLAAIAEQNPQIAVAARNAYFHGFKAVVAWPEEKQFQVFDQARVPTQSGAWNKGSAVMRVGHGVAPTHILATDFAKLFESLNNPQAQATTLIADKISAVNPARPSIYQEHDLVKTEEQSAKQQREFLKPWSGRIPADIVIIYLGFVGRFPAIKKLAHEWANSATADVETLWDKLDSHLALSLHPHRLPDELEDRRFLIEEVGASHILAKSLSGEEFKAPIDDGSNKIALGNFNDFNQNVPFNDGPVRKLYKLQLRHLDLSNYTQATASKVFRDFVEVFAIECLWLGQSPQQQALKEILDISLKVDQATLDDTKKLLQDQLPMILAEMKLPAESSSQKALREYQDDETWHIRNNGSAADKENLKIALWNKIQTADSAKELLNAVRAKIKDFSYSPSSVLFELFQNADDAYNQLERSSETEVFRVELKPGTPGGFRVVHWGRPINHRGSSTDQGHSKGYDRDLLNMLVMNFSEKRVNDNLTGKFGLGFKSVHMLTENVGIASGFIALRTMGGFIPKDWSAGIDEAEQRNLAKGRKATIIDVPFTTETMQAGSDALRIFKSAITWLPAFSLRISRIEIFGDDRLNVSAHAEPLLDHKSIDVVSVTDTKKHIALRFDIGAGFKLLLNIDQSGPQPFPQGLWRLWNLAPLEETLNSGWLLNGPFAVDAGRERLNGTDEDRQSIFKQRGKLLGERLLELHSLATDNWNKFSNQLCLDGSHDVAAPIFWSRLFDLMSQDFEDALARNLHIDGEGYARLANEKKVIPTQLPKPFDGLTRLSDIKYYTDGVLSKNDFLLKVIDWTSISEMAGRLVSGSIAQHLRRLTTAPINPITLATLIRQEIIEVDRIVDTDLAVRLGAVLTLKSIEEESFATERLFLREEARKAKFFARDGKAYDVNNLVFALSENDDEGLISEFATDDAVLSDKYTGAAVEFFKVARSQSGYQPKASRLKVWAQKASTRDQRRAALRYVIYGDHRRQYVEELKNDIPDWLPNPISELAHYELLSDWTGEEKDRLLFELGGRGSFEITPIGPLVPEVPPEPQLFLDGLYSWWDKNKGTERKKYAERIYPAAFQPSALRDSDERVNWFTMFALASFSTIGRTIEGQHRSFIERGMQQGWWNEIAISRPPDDAQAWMDCLEKWSRSDQYDQSFMPWRRKLVDLYTVARWLDGYREIMRALPGMIREHKKISLTELLRPTFYHPVSRMGIDAAPINRSLGIGFNWLVRELLRAKVYNDEDASHLAPYCWASAKSRRDLLNRLGADLGAEPNIELSLTMYNFIAGKIGTDKATFEGDFDLPLQLITLENAEYNSIRAELLGQPLQEYDIHIAEGDDRYNDAGET